MNVVFINSVRLLFILVSCQLVNMSNNHVKVCVLCPTEEASEAKINTPYRDIGGSDKIEVNKVI